MSHGLAANGQHTTVQCLDLDLRTRPSSATQLRGWTSRLDATAVVVCEVSGPAVRHGRGFASAVARAVLCTQAAHKSIVPHAWWVAVAWHTFIRACCG